MKFKTMLGMMGAPHMRTHMGLMKQLKNVHRTAWLAAACKHKLLPQLQMPRSLDEVAAFFDVDNSRHPALRAYLEHGVILNELGKQGERYVAKSRAARELAQETASVSAAFAEALVKVHHDGIYGALDHLQDGRHLHDLDHDLIARVSELSGPLLEEVLDTHLPKQAASHLELGCGHGRYIRHALRVRPQLTAVGVDLDENVANTATQLLQDEGLADRARVVAGDFLDVTLDERFDTVSLFNLLYYLAPARRAEAVQKVADWLQPGGKVILLSACQGGGYGMNILDVWFSSLVECGPLPDVNDISKMMHDAGLVDVTLKAMMPGESMYLVTAVKPKQLSA